MKFELFDSVVGGFNLNHKQMTSFLSSVAVLHLVDLVDSSFIVSKAR